LHRERGGDERPLCAWVLLNCLILVANSRSRHRIFQQPIWEPKNPMLIKFLGISWVRWTHCVHIALHFIG
jgi:hypothetical protein